LITTGHCFYYNSNPLKSKWVLGSHSIMDAKVIKNRFYNTMDYFLHPKFSPKHGGSSFDNYDIAIVFTNRIIAFNYVTVMPICLPRPGDENLFWNHDVIVVGELNFFWGHKLRF
jgi:hypothetical protein